MIKDRVLIIIEMLTTSTSTGNLTWVESSDDDTRRNLHRKFKAIAEDGTKYETEVRWVNNNGVWRLESWPSIWIHNDKLPGGRFHISGVEYDLGEFIKTIIDVYCKDMNPSDSDIATVLDEITKGISITEYRESKLNKILNIFKSSKYLGI